MGGSAGAHLAALVRRRQPAQIEPWLRRAIMSTLPPFQRFARGLRADDAAVHARVTLSWSQGLIEGHIHRCLEERSVARAIRCHRDPRRGENLLLASRSERRMGLIGEELQLFPRRSKAREGGSRQAADDAHARRAIHRTTFELP